MRFNVYKERTKRDQRRFSLVAAGMVMFGAFVFIILAMYFEPSLWIETTVILCGDLIVFSLFLFFYIISLKQYSLRFFFLGKEYEKQMAELLPHFASFDDDRKKQLIRDCKCSYRVFGQVLRSWEHINESVYRNEKEADVALQMTKELLCDCDDKSGWLGFINACDGGKFTYERTNCEGVRINDPLDGWEIHSLLSSCLFSRAFGYLALCVYAESDFTACDTMISEEYTAKMNVMKKDLAEVYTPALLTFRDELERVRDKLSNRGKK